MLSVVGNGHRGAQSPAHVVKAARVRELLHPRALCIKAKAHRSRQNSVQTFELRAKLFFVRGYQFGGGRRRGRAQVGGKVGDRKIGFMADGRDHRNRRVADRARHGLFIESPKVFDRAAAASYDHYIDPVVVTPILQRARVMIVKKLNRADDLVRGVFTLHASRREQDMNAARASRNYIDDVANGGAGGRSDDADASREKWNRAFQFRREQTFGLHTRLGLFESKLQRTGANRLERFDDQLILALGFVHADATARAHLQTVFGTKAYALVAAAIAHGADLRELIFQSEIPVPGNMRVEICNLALDPD